MKRARIEHIGLWVRNLEIMRAFYADTLGGASGPLYENPTTGFTSYFIAFGEGARLELMHRPGFEPSPTPVLNYGHIALALDSRVAVDDAVAELRRQGVPVESGPRVTGDGYYEAVVLDPEHNRVELTSRANSDR